MAEIKGNGYNLNISRISVPQSQMKS